MRSTRTRPAGIARASRVSARPGSPVDVRLGLAGEPVESGAVPIVEETRKLEPVGEGIGAGGKRLADMLAEAERLFAETGHYQGIADLEMMSSDPIGYEK